MPPKTETEQFIDETVNVLEQPLEQQATEVEPPKEEEESPSNRQARRLQAKLQAEREANIALAAKLETLSEAQRFTRDAEPSAYMQAVERIYGTDTPEAKAATDLLVTALQGVEKSARESALNELREEQRREAARVKEEERKLDSMVEDLEDAYSVTFTPDMQKTYFKLMEKMSPKDADGNITDYADPHAVYEVFTERLTKKPDNRAKDLSSRSMVTSGASKQSNLQDDAQQRYLREIGIL